MDRLAAALERAGAVFDLEPRRPLHFGDPPAELEALRTACALADRSDLARLLASGPDYLGLLHRLSTGDVRGLRPGEGRPTVLTTAKGRIVERLFVHHLGEGGILSVGGVRQGSRVVEHVARYTFAESTGLEEATARTFQLVVSGPRSGEALGSLGWSPPAPYAGTQAGLGRRTVHVLGEDGTSAHGFSIFGDLTDAPAVWDALASAVADCGGRPTGDAVLLADRVLRGLPAAGHELTEEHNPLEAGLASAVSFDKGCYVGQEVVARLRTYDKVARCLVGLELAAGGPLPGVGTPLFADDRSVGTLTTAAIAPDRSAPVALGYVKRRAFRPGLELRLGRPDGPAAILVELPFDRG